MKSLSYAPYNENIRYYDCGGFRFSLLRTSNGYYKLSKKDADGNRADNIYFSNLEQALAEMVSYCEVPAADYNTD